MKTFQFLLLIAINVIITPNARAEYVGCFTDSIPRAMPFVSYVKSVKTCIDLCKDRYKQFAGLQVGEECYCGNNYGKYGPADRCNMKCKDGNVCGGPWKNSVYRVDSPCSNNPCKNGGQCSNRGETFTCQCRPGFRGNDCSIDNPCGSNPCKNGGQCSNSSDTFTCQCRPGFLGNDCSIHNPCGSNPCQNSGLCFNKGDTFTCQCRPGFRGNDCSIVDPCGSNPCKNGGQCSNISDTFTCQCRPGFQGNDCSILDPCGSNPCKNGGQCSNRGDRYTCQCRPGFQGNDCSIDNPCGSNPCKNGGQCSNSSDTFTCQCRPGFRGNDCSILDPCGSNPCKNGGQCSNRGDRYTCQCRPGFRGNDCSIVDPCGSNPCKNGGQCSNSSNTFTCQCRPGFRGNDCSILDPCGSNPCKNGGQCSNRGDRYTCQCLPGFRGNDCSMGCGKLFDIMFMIEESGSIGMANFIKIKNLVKGVVKSFKIAQDGIRVGLITFSNRARKHFNLKDYQDVELILGAIGNISYTGGGTNTQLGLNYLRKWGFRPKTGDRPDVPNIAVVILNRNSRKPSKTATAANQLKQTGATVFAVGIGTHITKEELVSIASSPSSDYVFTVDSFTGVDEIKGKLIQKICSENPK